MATILEALNKLKKSKFRNSFHLSQKDIDYIDAKGFSTIESHAKDLIKKNLSADFPKNDGKQTPMKGHPVFIAQHATACCCRGCLNKWYHVPLGTPLSPQQQEKICNLIISWIRIEYENQKAQR